MKKMHYVSFFMLAAILPAFAVSSAWAQQHNQPKSQATYEKPAAMAGVKTVERRPEGGLPYYVRMSPRASKANPARLIVWLHPAGASANRAPESLTKRFIRNGYALLIPSEKSWRGWAGEDAKRLFEKSLPDAGRIEGIDSRKPILMGFSAGGQLALNAWRDNVEDLGGLIVDAAYPVQRAEGGRFTTFDPPDSPAVTSVPIYALVGGNDGGLGAWREVEQKWQKAGIPLTIRVVPNKGHEWLIGPKEIGPLEAWLKKIKSFGPQKNSAAAIHPRR